ncbi:NAD(P)H-dependent oxidoreductase [Sphingobium phenoxybenzoativorans]|jgi:FMN-dependent NADH-azoreductase|uniref:FMN dependent NADH:quinone oxidoreductase n=1 Tax=Sphingobium phenoxybenzoativorans TaxID=1592790 RepID=A0A975Q359_9SPHN|nr:NAD(P)H-dependent oxidoreductase [Sphingobium phenoxybenzoativorans]QUT07182.1 NAD(P)H-dependent oxidoreductase [Sphingobium phenoxybenzoativorans]
MKLLHIDSSILAEQSVSRQLSAAIVDKIKTQIPDLEIVYRDLASRPLDHFTIAGVPPSDPHADLLPGDNSEPSAIAETETILAEFLSADMIVIGAPMYNFTVPTQLKAWIDRILIAGRTFRYTAEGPLSLVGAKSVILALSRGGLYGEGSPAASFEHLESYLRSVFGFLDIQPQTVLAEGVAISPEQRQAAMAGARERIADILID